MEGGEKGREKEGKKGGGEKGREGREKEGREGEVNEVEDRLKLLNYSDFFCVCLYFSTFLLFIFCFALSFSFHSLPVPFE